MSATRRGPPGAAEQPAPQRGAPLTFPLLLRDDGRLLGEGLADGRVGGGICCWNRETRR